MLPTDRSVPTGGSHRPAGLQEGTAVRRFLAAATILALVAGLSSTSAEGAPVPAEGGKFEAPPAGAERIPDEWIVALQPFADSAEAAALARASGGEAGQRFERVFQGFVFRGSQVAAERLARHPRVRKVSPNLVVEVDAQTEPTGIRRVQAGAARAAGKTGDGVSVAVLDTGIDLDHPDLMGNIASGLGKNCITSGNSPDDDNGHGTHVAGTVAAAANTTGVVGVAPDVGLVPVKVLGSSGSGSYGALICGIDHITARAGSIDVANMSLGADDDPGHCDDGSLREAICKSTDAGIVYVVAAGNNDTNASKRAPANYGDDVITVSALDDDDGLPGDDRFASFSNYGSAVDLIAPGVNILSTARGGGTKTLSGTSMATPHVAGAVALALADGTSAGNVLARLQSTGECPDGSVAGSDRSCSGTGRWSGDGDSTPEPLVNARRAAGEDEAPIPGNDPTVEITSPAGGTTLAGTVSVVALVTDEEDDPQELDVQYRIDDGAWALMSNAVGTDRFEATFDADGLTAGDHQLSVRATDRSSGQGSDAVSFTIAGDEPGGGGGTPTVVITKPDQGDRLLGLVTILAKADDAEDPTDDLALRYLIDGAGPGTAMEYRPRRDNFKGRWETAGLGDGTYTVTVTVTDTDGNTTTSAPVEVRVDN